MIPILLRSHHYDSDSPALAILVFAIAISIIIYCIFFSRGGRVRRKIRKTGGKRISEFQTGEVAKAVGSVKYIGKTVTAPLSGRKCAYYYILVEELRSSGKSSSWHTLFEEEIAGTVVIKDGNYYAHIETAGVQSYLIQDRQFRSGFWNDATKNLTEYLAKHGHKSTGWTGMNRGLRYSEGILEEGELVAVVGKGTWKRKSELNFDIPSEKILVIGPNNEEPVYFSDDPKVAVEEVSVLKL